MFTNTQRLSNPEVQELRREGGRLLKHLREARGLSQRELCALVGAGVYTFISQIETGRGRVPPEKLRVWAEALGLPAADFAKTILPYYDPETYAILFGGETSPAGATDKSQAATPGLRLVNES
ncbi:helix-turn-helix domain-containing protein [Methylobacterium planeticum]|uniref:Helix-turn-helix domain-containing protein n=1 Tax=Methylobacterium planeticum TaxID=2615211 RepID=A0A6N6MBN3_9HYPH|nr:helix-turn-helix domain-containing protein [Methylobacterium planeticum]KAB1068003.1 helix-turn-helix domain-containing protein [Methylobacterium planeticum]